MPRHGPHALDVARHEQDLFVMPGDELIGDVNDAGRDEYPHESEVPLQRAAQPSADGQFLWDLHQIMLLKLWTKTRKRAEDTQAAADQYEQTNGIKPMRPAHQQWMLVSCRHRLRAFR